MALNNDRRIDIVESYKNEIKELEQEVIRVSTREKNKEISHFLMIRLQWLLHNEIHRLKTLIELFTKY